MIYHHNTGEIIQTFACFTFIDLLCSFYEYGLSMSNKNWHPDTVSNHLYIWIKNFFGLSNHFPLFFSKSIIHENIYMRNTVKSYLFTKLLVFHRVVNINRSSLIKQFVHPCVSRARDRLISRNNNSFYFVKVMERLQCHHQLSGGAIWICYNIPFFKRSNIRAINLRNYERYIRFHSPF